MNSTEYIKAKQIAWANRNNIDLVGSKIIRGQKAYTTKLSDNLFVNLDPQSEKEISNGDGEELKSDKDNSAKMCAVHSSSAIGVNIFQYWKDKDISQIAYSLGLCSKDDKLANEIHFEQKFEINSKFNKSPNIDVVINNSNDAQIKAYGIECKFSEAYSSRNHPGLKEKYLNEIGDQWDDIYNLEKLAVKISPNDNLFEHLHPAQLIKHILGMKKRYSKKGFKLLYLWYDVLGEEGYKHRKEIEEFSEITKNDNIMFHAISYQELIMKLKNEFYEGNEKYVNYLIDRYL